MGFLEVLVIVVILVTFITLSKINFFEINYGMIVFDAGIAVEAYGANISGSMQLDENSENSSNAVTLNLRRSYVSEPLLFADPTTNESVQLTDPAKDFLHRRGVEKFAERFGTHFIAGYTIGGCLIHA